MPLHNSRKINNNKHCFRDKLHLSRHSCPLHHDTISIAPRHKTCTGNVGTSSIVAECWRCLYVHGKFNTEGCCRIHRMQPPPASFRSSKRITCTTSAAFGVFK
jgi:hypothetical protein